MLEPWSSIALLLYQSGFVGTVLTAAFAFLISKRVESYKVDVGKQLENHRSALSRELETYKIGLTLTAERQRSKMEAYKALSAILERSLSTILAITVGLAKGVITEVNDELLATVEANTKDIYGWLYAYKLIVESDLYERAEIYANLLLNYQNTVGVWNRLGTGIGPAQKVRFLGELNNLDKEAHRYAEMMRPQLKDLFDSATVPATSPSPSPS